MQSTTNVLTKAHALIRQTGQPLAYENVCLQNMFILPSRIEEFQDDALYLKWLDTLIRERNNISLPEHPEEYEAFFRDCLLLKEQMKDALRPFPEDVWLHCAASLFESLKTPFYSVYAQSMRSLEAAFSDRDLFLHTLQAFYSVLIKSSSDTWQRVAAIADFAGGRAFHRTDSGARNADSACGRTQGAAPSGGENPRIPDLLSGNEQLLSDLLLWQLAAFASDKMLWLSRLFGEMYTDPAPSPERLDPSGMLEEFQQKEILFLKALSLMASRDEQKGASSADASWYTGPAVSLSCMESDTCFALRAQWFAGHRSKAPDHVFTGGRKQKNYPALAPDSVLNKYAYNMTAASYVTNPAIGREEELSDLELILISPKKSPILLGEAGVGKTSVAEGLAWLLQQGKVPDLLKKKEIYKLTTTSLLSGTKYVGEMEERIRQLMEELNRHPDIILFIDEIHTIVGAGSTESSNNDISNMLKPYIDRGDIKIIGSTTSDEYARYILTDKALARRFYPITIEEPDAAATIRILEGTIPSIEYETKVKNTFSAEETRQLMEILINLSDKKNQPADRRTRRPELPLTLLEMAFSYAALHSRDHVERTDFVSAVRHTNLLRQDVRRKAEEYFL